MFPLVEWRTSMVLMLSWLYIPISLSTKHQQFLTVELCSLHLCSTVTQIYICAPLFSLWNPVLRYCHMYNKWRLLIRQQNIKGSGRERLLWWEKFTRRISHNVMINIFLKNELHKSPTTSICGAGVWNGYFSPYKTHSVI